MPMECEVCKRTPEQGVTIYRANPVGEMPSRWRCSDHPCGESLESRAAVADVVDAILNRKRGER